MCNLKGVNMRLIIKQFLGAQRAKTPDIEIEPNLFVEGKPFILGTFMCEYKGQLVQVQERFETEAAIQKLLNEGVIIKENLNENNNQSV